MKGSRYVTLQPLAFNQEPVRIERRYGKGDELVITTDYFGEDGMGLFRSIEREQDLRQAVPLHVIPWLATTPAELSL